MHFGGFSMSSRHSVLSVKVMCENLIPSSLYCEQHGWHRNQSRETHHEFKLNDKMPRKKEFFKCMQDAGGDDVYTVSCSRAKT